MKNDDSLDSDIEMLVEKIKELNNTACDVYRPITYQLCKGKASEREVEEALDNMLGFCGSDDMLIMFKQICRCYYQRYPEMIAFEINAYREMWDM
jgi:hypothetical protein